MCIVLVQQRVISIRFKHHDHHLTHYKQQQQQQQKAYHSRISTPTDSHKINDQHGDGDGDTDGDGDGDGD